MPNHRNDLRPEDITLNKTKLKYLSTKKDSYNNENFFYAIEADDFSDVVATIPEGFKVPWFRGKKGQVLKVKFRWMKDNEKAAIGGVGDVRMKEYNFEGVKGYYVDSIVFL